MSLCKLKLITFDATNTLLKFRMPPWEYYIKIAKDYGFQGNEHDVKTRFREAMKIMNKEHPNYGKSSITWVNWWSQLVKMTLRDFLPLTADLDYIAKKLINEFKSNNCYCTADGSEKLLKHFRKMNITVGIISNFDPRLNDILQNVGLNKNLDFIVTSYEAGYSKPDKRIFKKALDTCKQHVDPSESLHIGDDLVKDYEGARAAGWHAVLVNCDITSEKLPTPQHVFTGLEHLYISVNENKLIL